MSSEGAAEEDARMKPVETMTKAQIEAEIASLESDVIVATDEGTHGSPLVIKIAEDINGRRYLCRVFGGSVTSREPLEAERGPVESVHGRMRWMDREPVASVRRERLRALRAEHAACSQRAETNYIRAQKGLPPL